MTQLRRMFQQCMNLEVKKVNPFLEEVDRFPIGTKEPIHSYASKSEITEDDLVYFPISKYNHTPTLIMALAGAMKTTMEKRIAYYLSKLGNCKEVFLDLKTTDWMKAAYKPKYETMLLKDELPDRLPIVPIAPNYVIKLMPHLRPLVKDVVSAYPMNLWTREMFADMGFTPTAYENFQKILKSTTNPESVLNKIKTQKMNSQVRQSITLRLGNLIDSGFFSQDPVLDITKYWNKNKFPSVHFFSQDESIMSLFATQIIHSLYHYGITHRGEGGNTAIFIDDSPLIAGKNLTQQGFRESWRIAAYQILKVLTAWRNLRINLFMVSQAPDLIMPQIVDNFKFFIIGKIGNTRTLERAGFSSEILRAVETLKQDQERGIAEYLLVRENRYTFERFFALGSPVGHHIDIGE